MDEAVGTAVKTPENRMQHLSIIDWHFDFELRQSLELSDRSQTSHGLCPWVSVR